MDIIGLKSPHIPDTDSQLKLATRYNTNCKKFSYKKLDQDNIPNKSLKNNKKNKSKDMFSFIQNKLVKIDRL